MADNEPRVLADFNSDNPLPVEVESLGGTPFRFTPAMIDNERVAALGKKAPFGDSEERDIELPQGMVELLQEAVPLPRGIAATIDISQLDAKKAQENRHDLSNDDALIGEVKAHDRDSSSSKLMQNFNDMMRGGRNMLGEMQSMHIDLSSLDARDAMHARIADARQALATKMAMHPDLDARSLELLRSAASLLEAIDRDAFSGVGPDAAQLRSLELALDNFDVALRGADEERERSVQNRMSDGAMSAAEVHSSAQRLGNLIFDKKVFDPYLKFSSPEDEENYRKREKQNSDARKQALAKHTPEGDREALLIEKSQIADAKDHGADRSPDFAAIKAANEQTLSSLSPERTANAVDAAGNRARPTTDQQSSQHISDVMAALRAAGVTGGQMTSHEAPQAPRAIATNEQVAGNVRGA